MSYMTKDTQIIVAQANTDSGFKLPGASTSNEKASEEAQGSLSATINVSPSDFGGASQSSSRDMLIGSGIFVVLLIAFFFARNAYANHLVARRVSPTTAGSAAWLLFLGLSLISAAIVLALINTQRFFSLFVTAPLVAVGLGALIATVVVGRR